MPSASTSTRSRPILIAANSRIGGIAEHVHYQAQELSRRGLEVVMLCHPEHLERPANRLYRVIHTPRPAGRKGWPGRLSSIAGMVLDRFRLALLIVKLRPRFVLWDSQTEYFAPLWAWPHLLLRAAGTISLANFHDPVRQRHFGPEWLHRLSLWLLYGTLDGGLVHGPVPAHADIPPRILLKEAPLGFFEEVSDTVLVNRRALIGIPAEAPLILSFGHIADRKNLDLLIEALVAVPGAHLLVAGSSNATGQKQVADYRALAERLGIAERVHFDDRFIDDGAIPSYFYAADIVALTYCREFVSQSGVLQHAAAFRKPVLVSCGPGPLRQTMTRFALGELVEPDSASAIAAGLALMIATPQDRSGAFAAYAASASWSANVDQLLELEMAVRRR